MKSKEQAKKIQFVDLFAISLSGICLIHCLFLPIIIIALPFLGFLSDEHWVHQLLIGAAIPISIFALYRTGNWKHKQIIIPAIIGLGLLFSAAFIEQLEEYETYLSVTGALILAYTHYKNSKAIYRH